MLLSGQLVKFKVKKTKHELITLMYIVLAEVTMLVRFSNSFHENVLKVTSRR